jgi:hypothetical protein
MKIKRGSTSVRRLIFIGNSTSTTGGGLTGLTHASAGLVMYYMPGDGGTAQTSSLVTATLGVYTQWGFVAVDGTNMPGWYEIGIPNAALDGGKEVAIQLSGATDMVPVNIYIELDAFDYQVATQPVNLTEVSGVAVNTGTAQLGVNVVNAGGTAWGSGAITAGAIASNAITDAKINTGAFTSAKFAAGAFDAVWTVSARSLTTFGTLVSDIWSHATRILTAGTNIALAKGTGIMGFNDLDAAGVRSAMGLGSANLDTQLGDIPTVSEFNARTLASADYATAANLATVAGYLDTEIAAILEDTGTTIPAQISALNNISTAQVLAQCTAALETAITELSGVPSATPTTKQALMLLYMALRNRTTTTASAQTIQNDAGSTIATATLSDDGTTMTKGEFA